MSARTQGLQKRSKIATCQIDRRANTAKVKFRPTGMASAYLCIGVDHLSPEIRSALETDLTIDITTTGRLSQQARRIEIWFLNVGGRVYITGTPGARDWFANLRANPAFVFHLKESVRADLDALATVVDDLGERQRVLESAAAQWYRQEDDLDDLVREAPMVRVTFRAGVEA